MSPAIPAGDEPSGSLPLEDLIPRDPGFGDLLLRLAGALELLEENLSSDDVVVGQSAWRLSQPGQAWRLVADDEPVIVRRRPMQPVFTELIARCHGASR